MRSLVLIVSLIAACLLAAPANARAGEQGQGDVWSRLLGDGLRQLDISGLLPDEWQGQPIGDMLELVAQQGLPRLEGWFADLLGLKDKGASDTEVLAYLDEKGLDGLKAYAIEYGVGRLLKELERSESDGIRALYRVEDGVQRGALVDAVVALADSGRLKEASVRAVIGAWPIQISDADWDWFAAKFLYHRQLLRANKQEPAADEDAEEGEL